MDPQDDPADMHIIYLHQYFNTPDMSGGTRSWEWGRRLVDSGHQVDVVTADRNPEEGAKDWYVTDEGGMTVHWLPVPYSNKMGFRERIRAFFRYAWHARVRARRLGGDLVFATSTPLTIAIPAIHAAKRNRIPMVFEVRDLWPDLPIAVGALKNPVSRWAARWLERYAYRNASRIIALSPGMKEGVVRAGYPSNRVTVIPNACDLELFEGRERAGDRLRGEHPWLGDRPLVIYAGTLGLINGVDYLARVAARTAELDTRIRFAVLGSGREEQKILATADELGVLDRNFFMLGRVPKREMPDWLAAADVATSLVVDVEALRANSANKFFDALASGTPVAINYGGWQAELMETEGFGVVLPPDDPDAAAALLVQRLRDRDWLAESGRNARRVARTHFDRDDLFDQFQDVLASATGV